MKRYCIVILLLIFPSLISAQSHVQFDKYFNGKTLRMDYFHTGTKTENLYSLDKFIEETDWAGSRSQLIDNTNLGKYMIRLYDLNTNLLIYSRGFCSLFGEWQTTGEAEKEFRRTFHESVLVPYPNNPAQVVIAERDRENVFHEMFSVVVKPGSRFINRDKLHPGIEAVDIIKSGPPSQKVDLLILGDGYTKDEMGKFEKDVKKYVKALFSLSPFKENRNNFNVKAVKAISEQSGPDQPRKGVFNNTAVDASFNAFDLPRYMLSNNNKAIRDIAGKFPYDQVYLLVNSKRYGGGGIFNLYACSSSDHENSDFVFIHEFGHAFGGLGDEYYSSAVAYNEFYPKGIEPWEPNITALLDKKNVKWKDQIKSGTPIPTPEKPEFKKTTGVFEGAGYSAKGLFRPQMNCLMFSNREKRFCPVCQMAIQRVIDLYTK